jgi:hypothetical protein
MGGGQDDAGAPGQTTLGDLVRFLFGRRFPAGCPAHPPDVFAVASILLDRTGAHVRAASLEREPLLDDRWPGLVEEAGLAWRRAGRPSAQVRRWWGELRAARSHAVRDRLPDALVRTLLGLLGAADEASAGLGLPAAPGEDSDARFDEFEDYLAVYGTLGLDLAVDRVWVLPKQHTPQRGLTIRSFSHHLCAGLVRSIRPAFHKFPRPSRHTPGAMLHILVLPWPVDLGPHPLRPHPAVLPASPRDNFAFFDFHHPGLAEDVARFRQRFEAALEAAARLAPRVDLVVLPEMALTPAQAEVARAVCGARGICLLSGLASDPDSAEPAVNRVLFHGPPEPESELSVQFTQDKHHRWCLDRWQIEQYGLFSQLDATREWWENTRISERFLNFVSLRDWCTLSTFVCEDLARQDPSVDLLRAVGPNLVVALLMDGPQIAARWSARYATVLAEDPGSSVLTVTSFGMCQRSAPRPGDADRRRVVGRWSDALSGSRDLELPDDGAVGLLLHVARGQRLEYTADGRADASAVPVLTGVQAIFGRSGDDGAAGGG